MIRNKLRKKGIVLTLAMVMALGGMTQLANAANRKSSNISYESNVEILDEETFKDEIEMKTQNGEEASDVNEEKKTKRSNKIESRKLCEF